MYPVTVVRHEEGMFIVYVTLIHLSLLHEQLRILGVDLMVMGYTR